MINRGTVLITDDLHPLLTEELQKDGFIVHNCPDISRQEVLNNISNYIGLVINSRIAADKELLSKATNLKFVCRAGSGLEVIDLSYASKHNIVAFNSPEGNRNAVAEHCLGMLLSIMNNIPSAFEQVRNRKWIREPNRGHELSGKTVALIAYGNTARSFAKLLSGFDVNILAYDKYCHGFSDEKVQESSLEDIFEMADIVSLHLPLTVETEGMIDYAFLSNFKKPIWLINTSRGKVLNTAALIKSLDEQKLYAAALDVLENEKLDSLSASESENLTKLIQSQKVLITPHIAGWTYESKQKIALVLLEKIRELFT